MPDVFSTEKRSSIMRDIKSSGNKSTEERMLSLFKTHKITGWRRNYKLFGKPDFTFPLLRIAIFIDGCFWHGHYCRNITPKTNENYWRQKRIRNTERDILVNDYLIKRNWQVIRIWECEIKGNKRSDKIVSVLSLLNRNEKNNI